VKVGDIVRMNTPLTPERYGVGLVQKIVAIHGKEWSRNVYHILWPDGLTSSQYDNEIVLIAKA
jgi:hypothetical protein